MGQHDSLDPEEVLRFWFGNGSESRVEVWFASNPVIDDEIRTRFGESLPAALATFFCVPLEHAEDLELQERCVGLFDRLAESASEEDRPQAETFAEYARSHRDLIRRFGRFPHHFEPLGRTLTPEEVIYLEAGGETLGTTRGEG